MILHVFISVIVILSVILRGDWREWKTYHTTMMYFALGNLTYNFLCASYFLWRFNPDFLSNHTLTEMLYTFIVFPATALMFLSHYPEGKGVKKILLHYVTWITIYVSVEYIYTLTDSILYKYGWGLAWSAAFDVLMFPMLRLFHKRPVVAYILSVPIAIFWIWLFDVPVHLPIEKR
ncbi:hypothetical protein LCL95_02055 [Bacillus timonensis]|nr:hypothetical protein [Bacillus timonensis]